MLNPLRLACQLALTTARFTVSFFSLSFSFSSSLSLSVYPSVRHPVSQRTAAAKSGCITKDIKSGYWVLCATKKSAYKAGRKINASLLDCATVEDADPVETRAKSEPAKKLNYMQASGSSPSPAPLPLTRSPSASPTPSASPSPPSSPSQRQSPKLPQAQNYSDCVYGCWRRGAWLVQIW